MLKPVRKPLLFFIAIFFSTLLHAAPPQGEKLNSTQILQLFSGHTAKCQKSKDQSTCNTFMGDRGQVKRLNHYDNKRKTGKWHAAGHQLCIHWAGKKRESCFDVYQNADDSIQLFWKDKLKATIIGFDEGNTAGF